MSDTIGRITVPDAVVSETEFPLRTQFPYGRAIARQVITHQFGDPNQGIEQRFFVGTPAARYTFVRTSLSPSDRADLAEFWEDCGAGAKQFYYDVPQEDQSFVSTLVRFEDAPLSLENLAGQVTRAGLTFVEVPASTPSYTSAAVLTRFPDSTMNESLRDQVQEIVPLVRIRVADGDVPDIFLSDRRVTVDGQVYQPRLLRIGEAGSDVLVGQSIDGSSDEVQFSFGNADRVMRRLADDTELKWARIELSLLHVQSLTKLKLWAGRIVGWGANEGPEFVVQASDPLSALTLASPAGTCSRNCWRRYGLDGCPATVGSQELDLTHFPDADASSCDRGYETPNGCLAHSGGANPTKRYFGGVIAKPQQVRIKDNSTGTWGIGRKLVTPTSQISDSLWGESLAEIWHDDDGVARLGLPVACKIAAGRDESDFYHGLGVIGRGPLGALTTPTMVDTDGDGKKETFVGHTLDGQPHHGWRVDDDGNPTGDWLGLRSALGSDPAGANDYFSLGGVGSVLGSWREATYGGSLYEDTYAAGLAFLGIRRVDEKGIQPSTLASHSMIAVVSKGLTGLVWSAPGSRGTAAGCTNPFWVAVNTYLRALGLAGASAATQEAEFDVAAAITCAAAADTVVDRIFGGGTEKQFRFKGVVDGRKPTRDWLRDILNNGLGYFTWSFGKLRLGLRINATAATNFHLGNMLWGSLQVQPVSPQFEKLTVEFADEEYLYAKNTLDYTDQDYAGRNGRVQNPLSSTIGLVGSATKSQAARFCVVRTREELGGVGETEQKAARLAAWKSTVLGLDTEAGMVTGLIHPEMPGGSGKVRIASWRLMRDWSIEFQGKTVTDSMYDLTTGTVPASVGEEVQPRNGARDFNVPPEPGFSVRVSVDDGQSLEIYGLGFALDTNTRTATSATFALTITGEADPKIVTANFAPGFFQTADAAQWSLKVALPGRTVTAVAGLVSNAFGDSATHTESGTWVMAAGSTGPQAVLGSVAAADEDTLRWQGGDGSLHAVTSFVPAKTGTFYPSDLTVWIQRGSGAIVWHGWLRWETDGQTLYVGSPSSANLAPAVDATHVPTTGSIYAPLEADETWTLYVAVGKYDDQAALPGTAESDSYAVAKPGAMAANLVSDVSTDTVTYTDEIPPRWASALHLKCPAIFDAVNHPELWRLVTTFQSGNGTGGSFVAAGPWASETFMHCWGRLKSDQMENFRVIDPATGELFLLIPAWNVVSSEYGTGRIKIYLQPRQENVPETLSGNYGSTLQVVGGVSYWDIVIDKTKAVVKATQLKLSTNGGLHDDGSGNLAVQTYPNKPITITSNYIDYKYNPAEFDVDAGNGYWQVMKALSVTKLVVGDARFNGDVSFGNNLGGGIVKINSTGAVIQDKITSPTVSLTLAANSVILASSYGSLSMDATHLLLQNAAGTKYVQIDATNGVTIVGGSLTSPVIAGGSLTITTTGGQVKIDSSTNGVEVTQTVGGVAYTAEYYSWYLNLRKAGVGAVQLSISGGIAHMDGSFNLGTLAGTYLEFSGAARITINSVDVIDTGRNANFVSLKIGGTTRIDSTGNGDLVSLKIGGTTRIDSSGNGDLVTLKIGGTTRANSTGAWSNRVQTGGAAPTSLSTGEFMFFWDSGDTLGGGGGMYIIGYDGANKFYWKADGNY